MERKSARCSKGDAFRISIVLTSPGLPMAGSASEEHPEVIELCEMCLWSEGQVWRCRQECQHHRDEKQD
jgi:hypothetical protein